MFTRYVLQYKHNMMKIRLQCFILYRPFHRFFFSTSNMDNLGKIRRLHCTEQLYKLAKLSSLKLIRRKLKLTPLKSQTFLWRGEGGTNLLPAQQTSVNFLNFAKLYLRFFLTNSKVFFPLVLTDSLPPILTMSKVEKKSIAFYGLMALKHQIK